MATPDTPPEPQPAAQAPPTPAQQAAVAEAGAAAATQAGSAAEAEPAVRDAIRDEANTQGVTISDQDVQRIAAGTIAALDAAGAFDPPPAPATEPTPPPAEPPAEPGAANTEDGSGNPDDQAAGGDTPPAKQTFAEKFMGKK